MLSGRRLLQVTGARGRYFDYFDVIIIAKGENTGSRGWWVVFRDEGVGRRIHRPLFRDYRGPIPGIR